MVPGLLALLVATSGIVGPGNGPDKSPQRYRLDVKLDQTIDLTAVGQGEMTAGVVSSAYVTLTVSDTTGGTLAHVVIDSMTITATGQMAGLYNQQLADSLRGEFIHVYIVNGRPEGAPKPSVEGNPVMQMVIPVVSGLYPGVGSKATDLDKWSDTTRNDTVNENGTQNTSQIVDWVVNSRSGAALTVTGTGNGTINADMGGQQVSGTVTSTANVTTPVGGPSSHAVVSSIQSLSLLNPALPEPIPVKVESSATMTQLP